MTEPATVTTSSLLVIPPELRISILSYLQTPDIKQLSLCSKACRISSLRYLYRRLNLSYIHRPGAAPFPPPTSHLERIRSAFVDPDGSLYGLANVVRHVTVDSEYLAGLNNLVTYYRGWVSLLPLFPSLNSLKIQYFSPIPANYYYEFDARLFNASFSALVETCPAYQFLKSLHIKTAEYRFRYPSFEKSALAHCFSYENERFLALNPGESILKYETEDTIPYPQSLEELYLNIDFRKWPSEGALNAIRFIEPSKATLKKVGIWLDLRSPYEENIFPGTFSLVHVTDLGLSIGYLKNRSYLAELEARFPNVEHLNLYVDAGTRDFFWEEEEVIDSCGRIVGAWAKTLKSVRFPWFMDNGQFESQDMIGKRITAWVAEHELLNLEKATMVRETLSGLEASTCSIAVTGLGRALVWSGVYVEEKLSLDGL